MSLKGIYLSAPHGSLIYSGHKKTIAVNREVDIQGGRVVCSKEDGQGFAFGIASIGPPAILDLKSFDERFELHQVPRHHREKWWPDAEVLYEYPVLYFVAYDKPIPIDVAPGTTMEMGEVVFPAQKEEEIPFGPSPESGDEAETRLVSPETSATIMSSPPTGTLMPTPLPEQVKGEEEKMPWKPSDAQSHTSKADTPAKQSAWAKVANERLAACLADGGEKDKCEGSAVRQANSVVDGMKLQEELTKTIEELVVEAPEAITTPQEPVEVPEVKKETLVFSGLDHMISTGQEEKSGNDGEGETHVCTCPNCGAQVDADLGEPCRNETCPKCDARLRGGDTDDKADERTFLDKLNEALDKIKGLFTPTLPTLGSGIKNLGTDSSGQSWFMIWPTNSYFDREGEAFTSKAIRDFINDHASEEIKGEAWYRHTPGSKFGTIYHQAGVSDDRFLCQLGTYDDTPVGRAFKEFFSRFPDGHPTISPNGWGASHGYKYLYLDRQEDGVYNWFNTTESSVLPHELAANPYNPRPFTEVITMNDQEKETFGAIGQEVGVPNLASLIENATGNLANALDEAKVEHKELSLEDKASDAPPQEKAGASSETPVEPESTPVDAGKETMLPEDVVEQLVAQFVKQFRPDELSAVISELKANQVALEAKLESITSTQEQQVAAKVAAAPRWSWFQASQMPETVSGKGAPQVAAKTKDNFPEGVQGVVNLMRQ